MNKISAAMSALNGLGSALGGFGTSAMSALDVFKSLTSSILGGFKSLMGGVLSALKGLSNFAVSLPKMVMAGIGRLSDSVLGALGNVARSLSTLFTGAATVGIGAMTVAITGLVAVTSRAVTTFASLGRSMAGLSASTGLSKGEAGGVLNRFSALGIKPSETAGMFQGQNPTLYGFRAGMFGLPSYNDPRFAAQTAAKFQSMQGQGVVGQMLSQQMLKSLNLDSESGRRMVSMSPQSITEQQKYAQNVNQSLGLDPSRIAAVTQQWDALTNKAQTLTNGVLLKLADEALPHLNRALDVLTKIGAQHAGGLGGMIEKGVAAFAGGVGTAFDGLLSVSKALLTLPDAAFAFADTMLAGLQTTISAIPSFFDTFLTGLSVVEAATKPVFDAVIGGFQALPQMLDGIWSSLGNAVNSLQAGLQTLEQIGVSAFSTIGTAINNILSNPTLQSAIKAAGAALDIGKSIGEISAPIRNDIRKNAENMGVPEGYSDLLSFAGIALAGRAALNGLSGALGFGGRSGGGGLLGKALGPLALGAGVYTMSQWGDGAVGGGQSVEELKAFMQQRHRAEWEAKQKRSGQKQAPTTGTPSFLPSLAPPSISQQFRAGVGNGGAMYQQNFAGLGGNSWANQLNRTPQVVAGWAGSATQSIADWAGDAYDRGTSGHGGWARSLDDRFGAELRGRSHDAAQNIGQARAGLQDKREHFSEETKALLEALEALRQEMRELRGVARENVHETRNFNKDLPRSIADLLSRHARSTSDAEYLRVMGY